MEAYCVTKYGSGWRKDVVKLGLEFGDIDDFVPEGSVWFTVQLSLASRFTYAKTIWERKNKNKKTATTTHEVGWANGPELIRAVGETCN